MGSDTQLVQVGQSVLVFGLCSALVSKVSACKISQITGSYVQQLQFQTSWLTDRQTLFQRLLLLAQLNCRQRTDKNEVLNKSAARAADANLQQCCVDICTQ